MRLPSSKARAIASNATSGKDTSIRNSAATKHKGYIGLDKDNYIILAPSSPIDISDDDELPPATR